MQAWCHGTAKIRVLCVDLHPELTRYGQEFPSTFNHGTLDPDLVIRRTWVVAAAGLYLECYVRRWAERAFNVWWNGGRPPICSPTVCVKRRPPMTDDAYSATVNLAARLLGAAGPHEVVASEAAVETLSLASQAEKIGSRMVLFLRCCRCFRSGRCCRLCTRNVTRLHTCIRFRLADQRMTVAVIFLAEIQ